MKKRIFIVATLVGILSLILITHFSMADAAEIKTIGFWSDQNEPWQQQVIKEMISAFQTKYPEVKMEVEYIAFKDRSTKLAVAVAGGTLPEVALLSSQFALSLPPQGILASLDDVMSSLGGPDRFYEAALSLATYDGHFYSLPYSTVPVVLWYRKDLLKKAALKPPETWSELYKAAKTLNEQGSGKYFGLGMPYGRNEWADNAFRTRGSLGDRRQGSRRER